MIMCIINEPADFVLINCSVFPKASSHLPISYSVRTEKRKTSRPDETFTWDRKKLQILTLNKEKAPVFRILKLWINLIGC